MAPQLMATKRLVAARAARVHGARDDLLAGAALAGDEHASHPETATRSIRPRICAMPALAPYEAVGRLGDLGGGVESRPRHERPRDPRLGAGCAASSFSAVTFCST